jgi:hypothetical protein
VESPIHFWFNLQQTGYFDRKDTMDRMNMFYMGVRGDRLVNTDQLMPGNVLAARYQTGGFHRTLVIRVVISSAVRLFFLDYGTTRR